MVGLEFSKTVTVGEHIITLPAPPKDRREVLFVDNKKEDAYWRRDTSIRDVWLDFQPYITEMYADSTRRDDNTGKLLSVNKEDSEYVDRIYKRETLRRTAGIWMNNGGVLTYIPNHYYFVLQWGRMQRHDGLGDYGDFREFQCDFMLLINHCEWSPHIIGLDISKAKKTGITNLVWSGPYLNEGTLFRNYNLGAMNIDQKLCAKTFRDYFLYSFEGLPLPLRPSIKSLAPMDGSIILGNAFTNAKNKKGIYVDPMADLNTSIFCVPTRPKAFDVAVMKKIWCDEFPKYEESPEEIWRTNSQAIKIQSKKNGIALLTSYTPDEDTKSFLEARKIFFDSELKTVQEWSKGQTKTGMICHHIPSYCSWEGAFNKYGKCDEKRAWDEISIERRRVYDNKRALQAITRQYATTKKEAWMPAGAGSTYDNVLLADILSDIESFPGNQYEDGRFDWDIELWNIGKMDKRPKGQFTNVKWVPLTELQKLQGEQGRVRIYESLHPSARNLALKQGRDDHGNLKAPERFVHVGGMDPTQYAAGSEIIEGSKNASYTMNMPDEILDAGFKRIASKIIISEYFYRPESPQEAYEDMVKEIIYYGKLVIVEANAPHVATMLIEEGLGRYMIVRNKETGALCMWRPGLEYQLIRTTANGAIKEMLETLVRIIKAYLNPGAETDKNYGRTIKSERLINQLMEFNPEDTKKYDLAMAFGYCLLCMDTYLTILLTPDESLKDADIYRAIMQHLRPQKQQPEPVRSANMPRGR